MIKKRGKISSEAIIIASLVFINAIILNAAITESKEYYKALFASVPLLIMMVWALAVK